MSWVAAGVAAGSVASGVISAVGAGKAVDKQRQATEKAVAAQNAQYQTSRADLQPYREAGQAALTRLQKLLGLGAPGGVDETDPRYRAIYDSILSGVDAEHRSRYGMPLLSSTDPHGLQAQLAEIKDAARKSYISQYGMDTGTGTEGSPLLRKFTQADLEADPVYQNGLKFGLDEGTKAIERRAASAGGYDSGATLKALTRFGTDYGSTKAADAYGRFRDLQDTTYGKLSGVAGMGSGATNVGVGAGTTTGTNLASLYSGLGNAEGAATIAKNNALAGGLNGYMNYSLLSQLTGGGQRGASSPVRPARPYDPSEYPG